MQVKEYMALKNDLVFAKTRLRVSKTGQKTVRRALMRAVINLVNLENLDVTLLRKFFSIEIKDL